MKNNQNNVTFLKSLPYFFCFLFFIAYLTLSLVKHHSFLTGYDLGVVDQGVWSYSQFKKPISTSHAYVGTPIYYDHVELIYAIISPLYIVWDDVRLLIFLYVLAIVLSALPIYFIAKEKKLPIYLSVTLLISYLMFYGVQNAIWSDVHSIGFGICFVSWFLYFLYRGRAVPATIFFILAITSKEDVALITLMVSLLYAWFEKNKLALVFSFFSIMYLFIIYLVYFPYFVPGGYRFQSGNGIFSDPNPLYMINTVEKRQVLLYSLGWTGFISLLNPLALSPFLADLAHFFVLGNNSVTSAQGLFMHYRVTLALLVVWPTILVLQKYKRLQRPIVAAYLLICTLFLQYHLHLPLSYLAKSWFWRTSSASTTIPEIINTLPADSTIVAQNNITPHVTHRDFIYTLWYEKKEFKTNSPCNMSQCDFFRWSGNPKYLIVDTSDEFDIRHFLANRDEYLRALENIETAGVVKKNRVLGKTVLYRILKNPSEI